MSEISREVALLKGEYDVMLKVTADEAVRMARLGASMGDGDVRELHFWVNARRGAPEAQIPGGGPAAGGPQSPGWGAPPFLPGTPSPQNPGLPPVPIPLPGFGGPQLPAPADDPRRGGIGASSELGQRIRKYVCGLNLPALAKSFDMWGLGAGALGYRKLAALASTAALACKAAIVACAVTATDGFVNSWARLHAAVDEAGAQSSTASGMAATTMAVWTAQGPIADFRRDFPKVNPTALALIEMDSTVPLEQWDGPNLDTGQNWLADDPKPAGPGGGAPGKPSSGGAVSPSSDEPGKELPGPSPGGDDDEPGKELPDPAEDDDDEGGKHAETEVDDGWLDGVIDKVSGGTDGTDWGQLYNDVRSELDL